MKVVVFSGSRGIETSALVRDTLARLRAGHGHCLVKVGDARGVDALVRQHARDYGHVVRVFAADWGGLGKRAGMARNAEMLGPPEPSLLVAIWDGVSPGTRGMIEMAQRRKIKTDVHLVQAARETA